MRVEIRESKNHKKIHELAMKVVDMVNATECDPFEIASALSTALSCCIATLEEYSGEEMLEKIIQGLRDVMKKIREDDAKR